MSFKAGARSASTSSVTSKELEPGEETCITELNLERNRIVKLNSKSIGPEDDEGFNKFLECFWKKKGYQKEDGQIDFEYLKSTIIEVICEILGGDNSDSCVGSSVAAETVDKCRNVTGNSHGQTASKVQNCIVNKLQEYE